MSERVIAISSEVVECGKRVSDSKKKFVWRFRIADTTYDLQLISSALSGKRIVSLNNSVIYQQQNVLNINFDFNYNINGHSLRIFRQSESVHNYDLRIDNRAFEYLLKKKDNPATTTKVTGKYQAATSDPFSEFQKVATNNNGNTNEGGNQFGDFDDFSNFGFSKEEKKVPGNEKKVQQPPQTTNVMDFDFDNKRGPAAENFQTNSYNNFQRNLNDVDLLSSDNFTTNNYGNYNNYLDLINTKEGTSDTWGMPVDPKQQTFFQKIKPDMTGKQMINKTLMTAVEIKKKAVNQFQSLI